MTKIIVNTKEIYNAVAVAAFALPNKSTLPVLEHLHFSAQDHKLVITATDQNFLIRTKVEFAYFDDSEESDFAFLVPGKRLLSLLKLVSSQSVVINVDRNSINCLTESGKYLFPTIDANEYINPDIFEGDNEVICELTSEDLGNIIKRTGFSIATDEFRPAMCGFCFELSTDKLRVITTDSFKLSYTTFEIDYSKDLEQMILPSAFLNMINKFHSSGKLIAISRYNTIKFVKFETENVECYSRIIEEKFVPYASVIPFELPNKITLNKFDLLKSLDRVSNFASNVSKAVQLQIADNCVVVYGADDELGSEAAETLQARTYGINNGLLKFNIEYLKAAILSMIGLDGTDITFNWNVPTRPAVLESYDQGFDKDLVLVMPVKG